MFSRLANRCSTRGIPTLSLLLVVVGCATQQHWHGRPLSAWLRDLTDPDDLVSSRAEHAIDQTGTNAVPYLIAVLAAPEEPLHEFLSLKNKGRADPVRTGAVLAFSRIGNDAARWLPTLHTLLVSEQIAGNTPALTATAQSMAGIGPESLPWLVGPLSHTNPMVRRASLSGLIDLGQSARDAMPFVLRRLQDTDVEVRGLALFFVSEVSDDVELKARVFREASEDSDPRIQSFAERELGRLKLSKGSVR
jgi:HEAT repeat protein